MKISPVPDQSIYVELSLDGNNYYQIDELNLTYHELLEDTINIFIEKLCCLEEQQNRTNNKSIKPLYFRLSKINSEEYCKHLKELKGLYDTLTKKEIAVLIFLSKGYKEKAITFILQMKPNTLHQHRKSIYRKMNFRNKIELAVWCDKYLKLFFKYCS